MTIPVHVLNGIFFALCHELRRDMLEKVSRQGKVRVTQLAEEYSVSLNTVSKHVKVLERGGLIQRMVQGRDHWLTLHPSHIKAAHQYLEFYRNFWEGTLDELENILTKGENND